MAKSNSDILKENQLLIRENSYLEYKLREAEESINSIRTGSIDALVISSEKAPKIFTEKTSDVAYRKLIEEMHEGAITLYEDGTIFYCNSYFARMANLPLQKVIGAKFINFIEDSLREEVESMLRNGREKPSKLEILISTSDRKKIPVLMSVNALSLENFYAMSIILTDLTIQNENQEKLRFRTKQLEQKNEQLENANKELAFQIEEKEKGAIELTIAKTDVQDLEVLNTHKENVLATISHDLRSPLATIISIADLLNESYESMDSESIKELISSLYRKSTDELSMLDYLLEWARIKYASEAFSPTEIELLFYVRKVFDRLKENAAAKKLQLRTDIEEKIKIFADGKMLLSIVQNIISNSIKHSYEGGEIFVSAKRSEEKIVVEIKDYGAGMSDEIKEKLFTPQIVSLSLARKENKGAGIGLLLVKGFLDKLGGEIWVESEEGKGSSFFFTLPAIKQPVKG